jgi:hypothetical protein
MSAQQPTSRGSTNNGGGYAAADLVEPTKDTGPPLGPPGCFASRCTRHACGVPLTPEPLRPLRPANAGRPSLPHPHAGSTRSATHATSLQTKSPRFEGIDGPSAWERPAPLSDHNKRRFRNFPFRCFYCSSNTELGVQIDLLICSSDGYRSTPESVGLDPDVG